LKVFKIECNVFKFDVLIVANCTHEELKTFLKKQYRVSLDDSPDINTIGGMYTVEKNPWRVVWVKDWKDRSCLIHELFHLTTRVCNDRGIQIVSHDEKGNVADEAAAYLMEFLVTQCLKRK